MLLLDSDKLSVSSVRKIIVLSDNEAVQNKVLQLLRTEGLENIDIIKSSFLDENVVLSAEEAIGVIIDIQDESDITVISESISSIVPQNMWCCVIGLSDSIRLSQQLLEQGILYFNSESQLRLMANKIRSTDISIPCTRNTTKVCVLTCKGGIGGSFISSHIAANIALNKKVPVLLAQGSNGSQDLDLLFDKKIQGDVVEYMDNLFLFNGDPNHLAEDIIEKYNFIIYDKPIFNINKDNFSEFFTYSNNFVLIVERKVGSLRVAKKFLEQCERARQLSNQPIRTFICLSDSRYDSSKLMAKSDIESLLNHPIDAIIPFIKQPQNKTVLEVNLNKASKREFHQLSMKVIGILSRQIRKKDDKSLFRSIYRWIMNN
ncbi:pilus assembly protein CpaE [Volucribacter psittacicida]|uniref:Pilus assembly protein CpaE n=1 Tax=Volucribacter psittacicida TaxID=203482 RepID=A0A4R1FVG4_9PAST|nr:pilus assembly protein [Volucribacter psittacicida]TCJ97824.1 pilus assembly protein CpaE [Volucribacter psittacicida]